MPIIGIDLGTTNSLVGVLGPDGPQTLANEAGEHLTPSAVAVAEDGTVLVGRPAKDRLVISPVSGRAFFKRDMGTLATYAFGGRVWTPTECSAQVLAEMRRIAGLRLGGDCQRAVITVPAYFHDAQRQATMDAARIAGLRVERIINEPTAAALAYGFGRQNAGRILVFDLGGGTFDVTVLDAFDGVIEVKASSGESRLGGEDWTDAICEQLAGTLGTALGPRQRARLRQQAEVLKRHLSTAPTASIDLAGRTMAYTRTEFETATRHLTARLRPVVRRCLRDAGCDPAGLDRILLVGGASRMPCVLGYIAEDLGRDPDRTLDPDRAIALGAAVQAALCADDQAVRDMVLTDVCPHTLGVMIAKEWAPGRIQPGFFSPIIERNTTVPVSRVQPYSTLHPEQDGIVIEIFQGENRLTADNARLGELRVHGLAARPGQERPGEIEVRFTYDMNGILEVEVHVLETGAKHTHVIESRPGALTPAQLAEAIRRMAPLKRHPRDLPPNRARLERARRLWADLSGHAREALNGHLDDFEAALESQEPERIATAGAMLDSFMGHFYNDEGEHQPGGGR